MWYVLGAGLGSVTCFRQSVGSHDWRSVPVVLFSGACVPFYFVGCTLKRLAILRCRGILKIFCDYTCLYVHAVYLLVVGKLKQFIISSVVHVGDVDNVKCTG